MAKSYEEVDVSIDGTELSQSQVAILRISLLVFIEQMEKANRDFGTAMASIATLRQIHRLLDHVVVLT